MTPCRRPACDAACISPPESTVGPLWQLLRLLALLTALAAGVLLLAAAAWIPGYRRARRGAWATRHAARWVLRALGVRVTVHGAPRSGPSLVVGNHVSWLDVLALASSAPMVMVAKSEVRSWPVIGPAAVRAGTLFLCRERPTTLPATVEQMTSALRSGLRVQVFPEATTRCGDAVGEFHRAAFQAAIAAAVVVSPVGISYAQDGRLESAGAHRTTAPAFVGTDSLVDSLRRVLAARRIRVTLQWLAPIPAIAGTGRDHLDRATVARLTENAVAGKLAIPIVYRGSRAAVARRLGSAAGPTVSPLPVRPAVPR